MKVWISNIKNNIWGAVFLLLPSFLFAQLELDRQVIGSAGVGLYTNLNGGFHVSSTVGEAVIYSNSISPFDITAGFQQSDDAVLNLPLMMTYGIYRSQCPEIHTGKIEVLPFGCKPDYSVSLYRLGDSIALETETDIPSAGVSTFDGLDSGTYVIELRGANLCAKFDTVRLDLEYMDCNVNVYNGITPNGDGMNDFWVIANIESNQPNDVRIFSRWGTMVWNTQNYDNNSNVWSGQSNGNSNLPDGTYFYIVDIKDNPDASGSGWIQLMR